jgi:hypothetical protein
MNTKPWFAGMVAFFVGGFLVVERSPVAAVLVGLVAGFGAYLWARAADARRARRADRVRSAESEDRRDRRLDEHDR